MAPEGESRATEWKGSIRGKQSITLATEGRHPNPNVRLSFSKSERLASEYLKKLQEPARPFHSRVDFEQLREADKLFITRLSAAFEESDEESDFEMVAASTSIVAAESGGMRLDHLFKRVLNSPEMMSMLMQRPARTQSAAKSSGSDAKVAALQQQVASLQQKVKKGPGGKGGRGGKGKEQKQQHGAWNVAAKPQAKGKGKGKGKTTMTGPGLDKKFKGKEICYAFSDGNCTGLNAKCPRNRAHVCPRADCLGPHPLYECELQRRNPL